MPFGLVSVLAEASILLPPGPQSTSAALVSVGLLFLVVAAFFLPWQHLPSWMSVLVPIAFTGSILALVLSTNSAASGLGLVLLVPVVWTALFHRRWESACVVTAVVAAEIVMSYVPIAASSEVVVRRVFLWAALGAVISIGIHGLRERSHRAEHETSLLQREIAVQAEQDRIADRIRETTMRRISIASMHLAGTIAHSSGDGATSRIQEVLQDLDDVVAELRSAVYDNAPEPSEASTAPAHPGELKPNASTGRT